MWNLSLPACMSFYRFQQEGEMRRLEEIQAAVTPLEACDMAEIFQLALTHYSSHLGITSNLKLWKLMYKHTYKRLSCFKRMSRSLAWALTRPARFKVEFSSSGAAFYFLKKKSSSKGNFLHVSGELKCSREFSLPKIPKAEQEMSLVDSQSFAYYYELL